MSTQLSKYVHTSTVCLPDFKTRIGRFTLLVLRQLARFPPLAVQGICAAIEEYPTDGTWILNMLSFVEEHVPIWPLWEVLHAPVEAIMDHP